MIWTFLGSPLILLLALIYLHVVESGWNIALEVTTQVNGAFGGEVFATQPVVAVKNLKGELQPSFKGRIIVQVETSALRGKHVPIWHHHQRTTMTESEIMRVSQDVLNGLVVFTGLGINTAGKGYRLEFVLLDEDNLVMATAIGDPFDVEVGEQHILDFISHPEMAFGGTSFGVQPVLAIKDRGGNIVPNVNGGTVSAWMHKGSESSTLRCHRNDGFVVAIKDGIASFLDLYINEAKTHYSLRFTTDLVLNFSEVISNDFSVGVGNVSSIVLINDASDGTVFGGKAFTSQPLVEVHDAGGNVVIKDSSYAIRISFYSNPSHGKLYPSNRTTEFLKQGVAQFRSLSIDKAGIGYKLSYTFVKYNDGEFTETSLITHGNPFDVKIGPPHKLSILRHSSGGRAGNQPFPIQPKIALVDAGGNIVVGDTTTEIAAHLTPSLSYGSRVIIDTSNDPVPVITDVSFGQNIIVDERTVYGPGDNIPIIVTFSQDVTVSTLADGGIPPKIALNVISNEGLGRIYADLLNERVKEKFSRTLVFNYSVKSDHKQNALNYLSTDSFFANDYSIHDAFGRNVDRNLPMISSGSSLLASKVVEVSGSNPKIVSITTDLVVGEYGAGHEINFILSFDREVAVTGYPEIPLNIESYLIVLDTVTTEMIEETSVFIIIVDGKRSKQIPWDASAAEVKRAIESIPTFLVEVCVARDRSPNSVKAGGFRWAIRFNSMVDLRNKLSVDDSGMRYHRTINGGVQMQTMTSKRIVNDWSLDDDDLMMCTTRTAIYIQTVKSKKLLFRYVVLSGDHSNNLGLSASVGTELFVPNGEISLLINSAETSSIRADYSLNGIVLYPNLGISINTASPVVVAIAPTSSDGIYAVGDILYFQVTFDKPVEVTVGLELMLCTETGSSPVARYYSGSGTEILLLEYKVREGEMSSKLDYNDFNSLVPKNTEGGRVPAFGYVRRKSTNPSTDANLDLSHVPRIADNHHIVIDGARPFLVTVLFDITNNEQPLTRADDVIILVHFSAAVVVNDMSPPMLGLFVGNNKRWADYFSGSGSSILRFVYRIKVGDNSRRLDFKYTRICGDFTCNSTKGLILRDSMTPILDANLEQGFSEQGRSIASSPDEGIIVDTLYSPASTVESVFTSLSAGTYQVGSIIDLQVKFTDIVFVSGYPKLLLNTNGEALYAVGHGTDILTFMYTTTNSDIIANLDWALYPTTNSAIQCINGCTIKNANGVDVDTCFISGIAVVEPLSTFITLDPSAPGIVSVHSDKVASPYCHELCSYTVGEEILIYVTFDLPVVVLGRDISLVMDVGDNLQGRQAVYDPLMSSTNELVFVYIVDYGHSSNGKSLNYFCGVSQCNLVLGKGTKVKGASIRPTVDADLNLPSPSAFGVCGDVLNPVIIDTRGQPEVMSVSGITSDGVYTAGDVLEIAIEFSRSVVVSGEPFLTLDVGNDYNIATYASGSGSATLVFKYQVVLNHWSLDLDYVDVHSLHVRSDGINQGSIMQASTHPTLEAKTNLALPGSEGSLSYSSNLIIDNTRPFVSSVSAVSGKYKTNEGIKIEVQFSSAVTVKGKPSLNLQVGFNDRNADFAYQPDERTLLFVYTVQLGDTASFLDYSSDNALMPSSNGIIQLNGGWIRRTSQRSELDADIHINPVNGILHGDTTCIVDEGVARFRELKIGQRGKDFKIRYQAISLAVMLEVSEVVEIGASIEYEVRGDLGDRDSGDLYGSSVSVHNRMLAVGAPGKRNRVYETQLLTVYSEASVTKHEIQIITTGINDKHSVTFSQNFSTCADTGEFIHGSFDLMYEVGGKFPLESHIIKIDSNATAENLKNSLEIVFNMVGLIKTFRSENSHCKSQNAWTWSVTFLDSFHEIKLSDTNGDALRGKGAYITGTSITQNVGMVQGHFTVFNPMNKNKTRKIPYNASGDFMKEAIELDLSITVMTVLVENMDTMKPIPELGRRWTIFFSHYMDEYGMNFNTPQLEVSGNELIGKNVYVWSHTVFEGRGPLSGTFALSFRGSNYSYFVSHDSSEEDISTALKSLDSVNEVLVSDRREFVNEAGKSGFSWTITFLSINKLTEYGWLLDPGGMSLRGNLPTLEVKSRLYGYNAGYLVGSVTGSGKEDTQSQWMQQKMGDDGILSGSVDIFCNLGEIWRKEATVFASDYNSYDSFGASVSIADGFLVVGAPTKEVDGVLEQQILTCLGPATNGFFFLLFRGFMSSPIQYDATLDDISRAITGIYGDTVKLHTIPRVILNSSSDDWDGFSSGFCSGKSRILSINFLTPDGGGISTLEHRSGDIEEITINAEHLIGATLTLSESRKGTRAPMGKDLNSAHTTGKQSGSVYIYKRLLPCPYCFPSWIDHAKLTPLDGSDDPTDAAAFGSSSQFVPPSEELSALVVIGSPGFNQASGKVYIFHDEGSSWGLLDTLSDMKWNHKKQNGSRFGSSIDADSDTILVGAPEFSNGKGAVYVFQRSNKSNRFLASQAIYGPNDIGEGDNFGHSISFSSNKAVLCAPYKTVEAIHIDTVQKHVKGAGACYVYTRINRSSLFKLDQQLIPSNILAGDRFGWSVAMSGNTIIVGQVEKYTGLIRPPRTTLTIKTLCNNPPCTIVATSTFRLCWIDVDMKHCTPRLASNISANRMQEAIEENLHSGPVSVSRSTSSDLHGGYSWIVTFDSKRPYIRDELNVPTIHCQTSLTFSLTCKVTLENDVSNNIRSKTHLFDFDEKRRVWIEQSFLFPTAPQRQDMMGISVAMDGRFAVAGSPNRELLNINSGAALIYDISFLSFYFNGAPYSVREGGSVNIEISRSLTDKYQLVSLRTLDRNAEDELQDYIKELYSLQSLTLAWYDKSSIDMLTGSTSFGRSQYYGSREARSLFINGQYDFKGINDYELLNYEGLFIPGEQSISATFKTNDDSIVEQLIENVTISINLRGMFASRFGRLSTTVHILDNGDGKSSKDKVQYELLDDNNHEPFARMGASIDYDKRAGIVIVGSDQSSIIALDGARLDNVGCAHIFKKTQGSWKFIQTLSPPLDNVDSNMFFGVSVAISTPYGREDTTVLVGAPGAALVYVYTYHTDKNAWIEQTTLSSSDASLPEHMFGGAVSLYEDMAYVGSSGTETVYIFRRSFVMGRGFIEWESYSFVRSSDYDFDVYGKGFTTRHIHMQSFGESIVAHHRTLLVGAPFAAYGNRGNTNVRENVNTNGIDNKGLGKGKVYAFHSQPHVQLITLHSDEIVWNGTFRLLLKNYQGIESEETGDIQHDSSTTALKYALEMLQNLGEVSIRVSDGFDDNRLIEKSWSITFLSSFQESHPILIPIWYDHGCHDCVQFRVSVLSKVRPFITVEVIQVYQRYIQEGEMQPHDISSGDLFGCSIDLDGNQAIIGSKYNSARTRTTWDFETGDLTGWSVTGNAFQFQPTYGDNSKHRAVYQTHRKFASDSSSESQSSHLVGRYYIGTFEKRPGDKHVSYQQPSMMHSVGSIQGDEPTGSLTSDPFMIRGDSISFLIGGGCNHLTVFIELLVDGYPSLRATGKCNEGMERASWNVSEFITRTGQIRIVDKGSGKWDHINVDQIDFSWYMDSSATCAVNNWRECSEGGGAIPINNKSEKQHYTGEEESSMSGAAYLYVRECQSYDFENQTPSNLIHSPCTWIEQERITASDKRKGNNFGASVSIDDAEGIALVGSSNSPLYGFYQEPISFHPHSNLTSIVFPLPEKLEYMMSSGITFSATGGNLRVIDYLLHRDQSVKHVNRFTEQAGAVYIFLREPANKDPGLTQKSFWRNTEHSKIAPPEIKARDHFGFSISLGGTTAVIGAIGCDSHVQEGGVAIAYDMEWVRVKFAQVEFVALEGTDEMIKIFVQRDLRWSNSILTIAYSTSDLSAVGVDTIKFDECLNLHASARDGCGDYEQTAGEVTFGNGEGLAYFNVRIMDDLCIERNSEYIQLNLYQLGGTLLQGENYRSQLRIDDNDWEQQLLSIECKVGMK